MSCNEFTEEDLDWMLCKHHECPYTSCSYHRYAVDIWHRLSFGKEYPETFGMFPKELEEVDNCTMHLDV